MGKYEQAIEALSAAIKKDPKNKAAYFHRAAAYFETGNFDEALNDYLRSDKGKAFRNQVLRPQQISPKHSLKVPVNLPKTLPSNFFLPFANRLTD